jgi:ATP-dependent DNA helicase RecQ
VGRISGRFGVERAAQMLVGSTVRQVVERGLDRIPTYGKLSGLAINQVKDLLGVLADAGFLERQGIEGGRPGAFVLALTPEGRAVARGEVKPELDWPIHPAPPRRRTRSAPASPAVSEAGDADPDLLARLKAWRTEEARRRSVPPYVILHDRTLVAIAATRPADPGGLARIKGIGPAKLDAYADALLKLMS